jgi:hypothetical protein
MYARFVRWADVTRPTLAVQSLAMCDSGVAAEKEHLLADRMKLVAGGPKRQ